MAERQRPWGVHRLHQLVAPYGALTQDHMGVWVRSVPLPYEGALLERLRAAWWVVTGRAHAVVWPKPGEFERVAGTYVPPKGGVTLQAGGDIDWLASPRNNGE